MIVAKLNAPPDQEYVAAYGIGYYYGRAIGDDEAGRKELAAEFGHSDKNNMMAYEGFKMGYSDGVEDYMSKDNG